MVDRGTAQIDHVTAVAAMGIGDFACPPMFGWDESNCCSGEAEALPPIHFVNLLKTKAVDKVAYSRRDNDGLVSRNPPQAAAVKVIKMSVGDKNEVDRGKLVMFDSCVAKAAHHQKPIGPVGVDENISVRPLNEEGGMPNPSDGNLT